MSRGDDDDDRKKEGITIELHDNVLNDIKFIRLNSSTFYPSYRIPLHWNDDCNKNVREKWEIILKIQTSGEWKLNTKILIVR